MLVPTLEFVLGLALLVLAADQLVVGAARLALTLRTSTVLVGAVIIGFGTSSPELLVTALAGIEDTPEIGAGNLVGSNVVNLAVVAAVAALIAPLAISSGTLRREVPLSVGGVILLAATLQGGLSRLEGVILLAAFAFAAALIVRGAERQGDPLGPEAENVCTGAGGPRRETVRTVLGLLGTLGGAQLVVGGSQDIAAEVGISEGFVGLTIVALGSSLPELVAAVQAARRNHADLIVGNVLGSNLFNSLLAGGILALIAPGRLADPDIAGIAAGFMVVVALAAGILLGTGRRLVRWEAAVLLVAYAAMLPLLSR